MLPRYFPATLILATTGIILSACGGGNSASTSTTQPPVKAASDVINGIAVPWEPEPVANAATLTGVDSNSNGVRDDAEREIARNSSGVIAFENSMKVAREYQKTLNPNLTLEDAKGIRKFFYCNDFKVLANVAEGEIVLNSANRKNQYFAYATLLSSEVLTSEFDDPEEMCK